MSKKTRRVSLSSSGQAVSHQSAPEVNASFSGAGEFLQRGILFFFHALLFTVPLFFTWVNEELFEFNKILFTYAFTIIICSLWVARTIVTQRFSWKRSFFDLPIGLFFLSQLLSTVFSIHPHTSLFGYYTRFHGGLLSTISYILLFYAFIHNVEKKHLKGVFLTMFASAFLVCAIAIPEHFGHSFNCLLINTSRNTLEAPETAFSPAFLWASYDATCWVQDVKSRVFATFGQPNWLAAYALILLPLSIALTSVRKKVTPGLFFYGLMSITLFITLLFTKSRSGILGYGAGTLFFLVTWLALVVKEKHNQRFITQLLAVIAILTFCAGIFGTPYTPSINQVLKQEATPVAAPSQPGVNRLEEGGTDSGEIRKIVWEGAFKVWQRYPLFGSGVETFAYSYYQDRPMRHNLVSEWDFLYNKAHNEFLNFLATTGIFGLLAYLFLLTTFMGAPVISVFFPHSRFATFKNLQFAEKVILLAVVSGIIALSISNFFGFSTVMVTVLLFVYAALCIVIGKNPHSTVPSHTAPVASSKSQEELNFSGAQVISLSLTSLMTLLLLVSVWNMWYADYLLTKAKAMNVSTNQEETLNTFEKAIALSPSESIFYEEAASSYGYAAINAANQQDATAAAQLAKKALDYSERTLELNPVNLNLFKSRTRLLFMLAQLDTSLIYDARDTLTFARGLAPTDPKILYNLSLVEISLGLEEGFTNLEKTVEMKPNYDAARMSLAQEYEKRGELQKARAQYQYILDFIQPNNEDAKIRVQQLATLSAQIKK